MTLENGKRAAAALAAARNLMRDRALDGATLAALGVDHPGPLTIDDPRLCPMVLEAGRAPGFGSDPIDVRISDYLDGRHGAGRWRVQRPPYPWERGGGDAALEELLDKQDAAIADRETKEAAMWAAWDEQQRLRRTADPMTSMGLALTKAALRELNEATVTWEESKVREQHARGQAVNRMSRLQEGWLRSQAAKS